MSLQRPPMWAMTMTASAPCARRLAASSSAAFTGSLNESAATFAGIVVAGVDDDDAAAVGRAQRIDVARQQRQSTVRRAGVAMAGEPAVDVGGADDDDVHRRRLLRERQSGGQEENEGDQPFHEAAHYSCATGCAWFSNSPRTRSR